MSVGMAVSAGANLGIGAAIGIAAVAGARVPASLRCTTLPNIGFVLFDFNPKEMTFNRSSSTSTMPRAGGGSNNSTKKVPTGSKITIGGVIFEGWDTKLRCDTLLTWMSPDAGFLGQLLKAAAGLNLKTQPPELTFQWGPPMVGFMYTVKMTGCTIKYTRFTSAGIPIRAEVSMNLLEIPTLLGSLPQNPTSGGLIGRSRHVVGHGESLQSISNTHYGTPALWRKIAEVNQIKDPARLRPGSTVYLPNADELINGGS
ncbi:MAG TPA: LysM peptidoglycan-binding domain-containing protein [Actinophytocola sp.]|uniref:CIS tube protein n=1 Tax=Actinophytocola sp. TaxID=1872138 RepID=UPI002DDD57D9|nr:LysM peptidoglycan-binding domain-containing protein [Actinophytocola sp.]HEV2779750.1 LysM peptidoglycan-binding domain-containing protein [Actinophytocola sp.]